MEGAIEFGVVLLVALFIHGRVRDEASDDADRS
jgi:hypothetical protein